MKNNRPYHTPVLLKESIDALKIKKEGRYIDGTIGGGGHSGAILEKGGLVLGIDKDLDAIKAAKDRLKEREGIEFTKGDFKDIKQIALDNNFQDCDGILLDLGVSSYQLENENRGFSFKDNTRLDMRMDRDQELSAFEVVNKYSKDELVEIFQKYGEEPEAREIADLIVRERKMRQIANSSDLLDIVLKAKKRIEKGINPATRVFQAIRIAVNDELGALQKALTDGIEVLGDGGRFVIISFHSLEDRIVKKKFLEFERNNMGKQITKKPITASIDEILKNRRSRSAKLRIFEKN